MSNEATAHQCSLEVVCDSLGVGLTGANPDSLAQKSQNEIQSFLSFSFFLFVVVEESREKHLRTVATDQTATTRKTHRSNERANQFVMLF